MKKFLSLLSLAFLLIASASCQKMSTELSEKTLPATVTVAGHVRIITSDSNGSTMDPVAVNPGMNVNIYYGIKGKDGQVNFAIKTVPTGPNGYFEAMLPCIPGQALTIEAHASTFASTYGYDQSSMSWIPTTAYFYGEDDGSCGIDDALYLLVDMKASVKVAVPDLK